MELTNTSITYLWYCDGKYIHFQPEDKFSTQVLEGRVLYSEVEYVVLCRKVSETRKYFLRERRTLKSSTPVGQTKSFHSQHRET